MRKMLFFLLLANTAMAQTLTTAGDTLQPKEVITEEVVVKATRAGNNAPTTFQVIEKAELNKNNLGQDLPVLLDNTPSVVTTSDAGAGVGYTGIRIRGSDNTRVNVTLNGIPVNDAESQGVFWVDLPDVVSSAQSIQIQRGAGASTNGPGAFGGTISLQTQSVAEKAFGGADISAGSFNTFKITGRAGTGLVKNRFFIEGNGSWITSQGYIDRAASNLQSWFAQAGYRYNKTLLKLVYFGGREKTYQAWNGVPQDSLKTNRTFNDLGTDYGQHLPPYANQTDNYGQDYFQLLFAQQLPRHLYLNLGAFATLGRGYYEELKAGADFTSYFPDYDTVPAYTDLARQKWLKNVFYGGTFALNYEHKNVALVLGGLLGQFRGRHYGKVIQAYDIPAFDAGRHYYDGSSTKNDFNVYAKFNYLLLHKVNLYADLQYRYVAHCTGGTEGPFEPYSFNNTWHFVNPKAGVLYNISGGNSLYLSYALANREPNRDDLLANAAARPETLHDVELGYKGRYGTGWVRGTFNANYYLMYYKDQLVLTGRLNDVGNPIKANVPQSYRTGVELSGALNFFVQRDTTLITAEGYGRRLRDESRKVFAINYSFAYSINKIKSFDEYIYTYDENYAPIEALTMVIRHRNTDISFSPDIIASLELVAYPVKGLSISLMNKAVSRQYLDNTGNSGRIIKPFYYSNLNISYTLPLKRDDKIITLKLLLNNVFNHLYESNGYTYSERYAYQDDNGQQVLDGPYTYNYYYPQAGFNLLAGISLRF